MTGPHVTVAVLGPLEIRAGGCLLRPPARKDAALVALIALAPGRSLARSRIAALLWGEAPEGRARDSLKQALLRLRRLGAAAGAELVLCGREAVALAAGVEVDADALAAEPSEPGAAARAIGLRRGALLEGLELDEPAFRDWLLAARSRIDARHLAHARAAMAAAERAGRAEAAMAAALAALAADPLDEGAIRLLMRHEAARGERRQALQRYERLRARLAEELAVEPEAATAALAREIRGGRGRPAAAPHAAGPSVAVLRFANIGEDPTEDYFADGLAEDLTTDLARIEGLSVAARHAVLALGDRGLGPVEAAAALGVSHVLEGSVRRDGGALRLAVRLLDGASGRPVWAERYDRPAEGVFALQDELARAIALALARELGGGTPAPGRHGTADLAAYELYLKGRAFAARGLYGQTLRVARLLFARAVACDAGFAHAHAELAICESHLAMTLANANAEASFDACLTHARRALALDPRLAEAHAALGLAFYAAGRYPEADVELDRAMARDPGLFDAVFFQGRNRRLQGRRAEAAALFERAAALRADDFRALGLFGEELQALGRDGEARAAFGRCLGRLEAALEAHPDNAGALAFGAAVLADLGRPAQAEDWAEWALVLGPEDALVQYNVARTWAMLDRPADALARLEAAFARPAVVRRRLALWMALDEDLAGLAGEPRFAALLAARAAA